MDNVKTDNYYIQKIRKDLEFIIVGFYVIPHDTAFGKCKEVIERI